MTPQTPPAARTVRTQAELNAALADEAVTPVIIEEAAADLFAITVTDQSLLAMADFIDRKAGEQL